MELALIFPPLCTSGTDSTASVAPFMGPDGLLTPLQCMFAALRCRDHAGSSLEKSFFTVLEEQFEENYTRFTNFPMKLMRAYDRLPSQDHLSPDENLVNMTFLHCVEALEAENTRLKTCLFDKEGKQKTSA